MNKLTFLPAVSVFALAAGFTSGAFAQACNPGVPNCVNVKVTVEGNKVSLDPATVTVTPRAKPAVKIVWYLATPGYVRQRDGQLPAAYFMSNDPRFCYPWTITPFTLAPTGTPMRFHGAPTTRSRCRRCRGSPLTATGRVVNN
jgi:hypothetical protein